MYHQRLHIVHTHIGIDPDRPNLVLISPPSIFKRPEIRLAHSPQLEHRFLITQELAYIRLVEHDDSTRVEFACIQCRSRGHAKALEDQHIRISSEVATG